MCECEQNWRVPYPHRDITVFLSILTEYPMLQNINYLCTFPLHIQIGNAAKIAAYVLRFFVYAVRNSGTQIGILIGKCSIPMFFESRDRIKIKANCKMLVNF
jgi:hypothetical protein